MKKFLFSLLFIIAIFSIELFAQISVQNFVGTDSWKINLTYDVDSAATLTTKQFSMDDFDGGLSVTHPATFYHDQDSDGAPATEAIIEIILWGVYNGASYTYPLDTLQVAAAAQGVDDTLGVLTLNTWSAPSYYITIVNTGGNASGVTQLTFPLREHGKTSELDNTH